MTAKQVDVGAQAMSSALNIAAFVLHGQVAWIFLAAFWTGCLVKQVGEAQQ